MSSFNRNKESKNWNRLYWLMVLIIFVALVILVRFVLNVSRINIDKSVPINPYHITWEPNADGSLRLNDPYYMNTDHTFINNYLDEIKADSALYNVLILNPKHNSTLRDIEPPYLMWKDANNDTIHILKNDIILNFKFKNGQ